MAKAILSASGAETQLSDEAGLFTLHFPHLQAGDWVEISAQKAGCTVVHSVLLQHVLPKDATAPPAIIVLVGADNREDKVRRYFGEQGSLAAAETKWRWLQEPRKHSADELQKILDKALLVLVKQAPIFAREELEQNSVIYRRALRMLLDQQLDEALHILPTEARLSDKTAPGGDRRLAREFQLKGRVLVLAFRFDEARKAYESAVAAAPDDFEACFEHALTLDNLGRSASEVIPAYDRALNAARVAGLREGAARTLYETGAWHRSHGDEQRSRQSYEEALGLYREMEKKSPGQFLSPMQFILENLGSLYVNKDQRSQAIQAFEEALQMAETLEPQHSEFLDPIAFAASHLGILHQEEKRLVEARQAYEKSKAIYERLSAKDQKHLPDVAREHGHLATLAFDEKRPVEAAASAREALKIYEQLDKRTPGAYAEHIDAFRSFLESLGSR